MSSDSPTGWQNPAPAGYRHNVNGAGGGPYSFTPSAPNNGYFPIAEIDDVAACAAACSERSQCVGFNWYVSGGNAAANPCQLATSFDQQQWTPSQSWEAFRKGDGLWHHWALDETSGATAADAGPSVGTQQTDGAIAARWRATRRGSAGTSAASRSTGQATRSSTSATA